MRSRLALAAVALAAVAALAPAGSTESKVKGLGTVAVRWNEVGFREELMKALAPGLTWRLGKDGPSRLTLSQMALVGQDSVLLPGKMTLNLRYWSDTNWQLVVFEDDRWNWGEDVRMLAITPVEVGRHADEKEFAKRLTLELQIHDKKSASPTPGAAITGGESDEIIADRVSDRVAYGEKAQPEWDAAPVVELHIRFGPHHGLARFEAVKAVDLKGTRAGAPLVATGLAHPAVAARTEFLEKHQGQLTVAVVTEGAVGGEPVALTLTGGEVPTLWPVRVRDGVELDEIAGKRSESKKSPKTVEYELAGSRLTVHLDRVDYTFDLAGP